MKRTALASLIFVAAASSCTRAIHVEEPTAGSDYRALQHEITDAYLEKFRWAAIDVAVPAPVARSIRAWELSNVTLYIFRCDDPADHYPAFANLDGNLFDYHALKQPLPSSVKLTFYLREDVEQRGGYDCAALDARGYSPIFLHSQTMPLPPLRYVTMRANPNGIFRVNAAKNEH